MRCALILTLAAVLAGCGPSCAERGGQEVYTGSIMLPMLVGKVMVMNPVAQYRCEVP